MAWFDERVKKKRHRMEDVDLSDGAACRELARAILKFGEIYERIESSKQQQMMELEKQRMEFTKEVEFERMNLFVDAQLELKKKSFCRDKLASSSGDLAVRLNGLNINTRSSLWFEGDSNLTVPVMVMGNVSYLEEVVVDTAQTSTFLKGTPVCKSP
ncbi:hypothetical protein OIU85_006422 [Salix viminalis]|uniref:Uncharacterized protein n=1 Tax=Salix viminalis TaxID=40686 RepID=A0A9Q0PLC4_SALVM|nr:hypothetical protein OIU85_006422 [Salix viminalis]